MNARLVLALLLACACSKPSNPQEGKTDAPHAAPSAHADEAHHEPLPSRVRLRPEVIANAKIQTAAVARETLAATLELPGEVSADPDRTAKLSALVGGRVERVNLKEGQRVKKGDVLVVIKVPELGKAKAAFLATAAKATAARSNADRLQALLDERMAGTQEVLSAKAEADALEAEAKAAREQLAALGTSQTGNPGSELALRAPVDGVVVARDVIVGQPVAAEQALATIADMSELWFLGRVFEKNLAQVEVGAPAEVELNAYPKKPFSGSVEYLSKQIDPVARTVVARIRLGNPDGLLRLGLFGVARVGSLDGAKRPPVLVVPRSAVTEVGQKPVVFVRQPDGDFDLHEVVLGEAALGKIEVLSGLREGEQVVVDGVFTLKSAVLKSTFGEED